MLVPSPSRFDDRFARGCSAEVEIPRRSVRRVAEGGEGWSLTFRISLFFMGIYIPANAKYENSDVNLRQMLLQEAHDSLYSGHFGTAKTTNRLLKQFYWPEISARYCRLLQVMH